jgi:RimJ/RimL family protein N-acetyltransferase
MLPIQTDRLELRDFRPDDFDAVHAYASDPQVTRFVPWGPNTEEDTRIFMARVAAEAAASPRITYSLAIVHRADGALVGSCGLYGRRVDLREYEVGYVLHRDWWGRGIAPEAVAALLPFGFGELKAHRIYAQIDPGNHGSIRVVACNGFRLEGHHRKDCLVRGVWRDTLIYARLDEE